jgi:hypothetical protein
MRVRNEPAAMRGCFTSALWAIAVAGCGSRTALLIEPDSQCQIHADAAIGTVGDLCYPESAKPNGPCSSDAPACPFCSYPSCPVLSNLLTPRTFYDCTCVAGSWSCAVVRQAGSACAPTISCLQADGETGAVCLVESGESCGMAADGGGPICVLTSGVLTGRPATSCGGGSCSDGCSCSDPVAPACTCQ